MHGHKEPGEEGRAQPLEKHVTTILRTNAEGCHFGRLERMVRCVHFVKQGEGVHCSMAPGGENGLELY